MSLIYGLKTQHGVYLAADTRLTTTTSAGVVKFEDDFGKFHSFGKNMHVVAAGDARLASFLLQKIQESDLGNSHFSAFRQKIRDFINNEIGFYPHISAASNVVFIFAGSDPNKKEKINMDKLVEYTRLMQGDDPRPIPQNIGQKLLEAMQRAAAEGKKGKLLELETVLKGLFSLEIILDKGVDVKLTDAEWATYLMYGPNKLTAKDASPQLVIDIDLGEKPKGFKGTDVLLDSCLKLTRFFTSEMIPKHQLHTVGGSIVIFLITEHGALFPAGEIALRKPDGSVVRNISSVFVHDGNMCTKIGDEIKPIRFLINYFNDNRELSSASI